MCICICICVFVEVYDVMAIAWPTEVCEALLRLKHGSEMICHVVANQSDIFWDVASGHPPHARQEAGSRGAQLCPPGPTATPL